MTSQGIKPWTTRNCTRSSNHWASRPLWELIHVWHLTNIKYTWVISKWPYTASYSTILFLFCWLWTWIHSSLYPDAQCCSFSVSTSKASPIIYIYYHYSIPLLVVYNFICTQLRVSTDISILFLLLTLSYYSYTYLFTIGSYCTVTIQSFIHTWLRLYLLIHNCQ